MVELGVALQNGDALITLAVLMLAVVLFISGAMAPELVGLLSVALLMIGGVLTPIQALSGFGSPALITLMGLFAVSAALFRSGALPWQPACHLASVSSLKTSILGISGNSCKPAVASCRAGLARATY